MTAPFRVVVTDEARADLLRLQAFAIERELAGATPDLDVVQRQREALGQALKLLAFAPYSCRKAQRSRNGRQRELVVRFGNSGLVAAFEIRGDTVWVGAVRHQLEQDFLR